MSRLRANVPRSTSTDTLAERITRVLEIKYLQDYDHRPPKPFDWAASLERTRQMIIERGKDPDEPYS